MVEVLYEDNHLLVINKPAGIPVQNDESQDQCVLELVSDWLAKKYQKPGKAFVGLIHRLDRPVSGALVLAKTSKALERMNAQFRDRETNKCYHCISDTDLIPQENTLEHFIGKDAAKRKAFLSANPRSDLKPAILHYKLIAAVNDRFLYEVLLETGRFHQIRAQMAKVGAPLLGDLKYGAKRALPDKSIALHARSLSFLHPVTKALIKVTAPYPKKPWWQPFYANL